MLLRFFQYISFLSYLYGMTGWASHYSLDVTMPIVTSKYLRKYDENSATATILLNLEMEYAQFFSRMLVIKNNIYQYFPYQTSHHSLLIDILPTKVQSLFTTILYSDNIFDACLFYRIPLKYYAVGIGAGVQKRSPSINEVDVRGVQTRFSVSHLFPIFYLDISWTTREHFSLIAESQLNLSSYGVLDSQLRAQYHLTDWLMVGLTYFRLKQSILKEAKFNGATYGLGVNMRYYFQ